MIKIISKKIFLSLFYPISKMIKSELNQLKVDLSRDISLELQRRATQSTADYVKAKLSHLDSHDDDLKLLEMALKEAELDDGGLILEFGVCRGRTINHIASLTSQRVYGFDSFEGLPERWRDGYSKGAFRRLDLPNVRDNVTLVKGLYADTVSPFLAEHDGTARFVHIDCDLYSSTKTVLAELGERIAPGTIIVFDEYFNYDGWQVGEFLAFQEFTESRKLDYKYIGYNRLNEQVAVKII